MTDVEISLEAVAADDGQRLAECGACRCQRLVTDFMRHDPDQQFTARPKRPFDAFYCGCQNDDDFAEGEILPDLGDQ